MLTNFLDSRYLMLSIYGHLQIYTCKKAANRNRCAILQAPSTPGTSSRHSLIFFELNQHKQESPPSDMVFFHVLVPL